jgi:hypothetical protein
MAGWKDRDVLGGDSDATSRECQASGQGPRQGLEAREGSGAVACAWVRARPPDRSAQPAVITLRDLESRLPARLVEPLTRGALFATSSTGLRRIPVSLLEGVTRFGDRPAMMLLAGREPWIRYLPERFFAGTPGR